MFNKINKKITSKMGKDEVMKIIFSEKDEFYSEEDKLVKKIKNGEDKNKIFNQLDKECNNNELKQFIIDFILSDIAPYEETAFLRECNSDAFSNLIRYMLENTIIQRESNQVIKEKTGLDDNHIIYTKKLLNTVLELAIVRRYTFNFFKQEIIDLFQLEEAKIEMLWDLFIDRKKELEKIILIENRLVCEDLKDEVEKLARFTIKYLKASNE